MSPAARRLAALARTTSFQLTLSYSVLFGISVVLLTAFFYWSTIGLLVRETDATLKSEITGLAEQYIEHGLDRLVNVIAHRIRTDDSGDMLYLFATPDNRPLAGNLRVWPEVEPDGDGWIEFVHQEAGRGRETSARGRVYRLRDGLHLLVARNIDQIRHLKGVFNRALAVGLGLTLVLGAIGGLFMASRILNRVSGFTETTAAIVAGQLDRRLPTTGGGDEFDLLASHVNAMLDRLEALLETIRHVSDNIAHDLRTPLTRLRNRIDLAARQAPEALRDELESSAAEADALLATFSALLRIARIEAGTYEATREPVDLGRLLDDAVEFYQDLAEEQGVTLITDSDPECVVTGDRDLLFQAVANLIDNALKFAPAHSAIALGAHRDADYLRIVVADSGPGIPAGERSRVTQRFARLDHSRSKPGSGLGLSLVQAVADHHRGSLDFADNRPGLRVSLRVPSA